MNVPQPHLEKLGVSFIKESKGVAEYRLDKNGLKIILAENHASPVVTVMPLYRVGSRNEAVGYTGATHILEHMMFKGVKDGRTGQIYNFPELLKPFGGQWNATTWFDRTNYYEVVPKDKFELCLAAESDRMRNLVLNDEERASEMTVVRNELERGQNDPTSVMLLQAYAVAFREHPYHHPTIGWVSDVEGITIDRLKQFYDEFYWPDNTSLLVMGDFESAHALELIAKYYGVHPRAPKELPSVYTVEPKQEGERRFTINRAGDAPRVVAAFHVPEAVHADTYPLAVMADVLGGSRKTSRLYKALVETQLCASASVWNFQQRDPGLFLVMATVAPGVDCKDVETAIHAELAKLASEPPSADELRRAKSANRKSTALAAADPMSMANQLAEAESVSDWSFYVDYDDNFEAVSAEGVQRVAATYFDENNRTVGYFLPKKNKSKTDTKRAATASAQKSEQSNNGTFASKTKKVTLDNGLTLLVMPTPGTGVVGIAGKLRAGGAHALEKPIVSSLTANQLTSGSATRSAEDVSSLTEEMGTRLAFAASNFGTKFSTQVVPSDLNEMLGLIADLLAHPAFPEKELATAKMMYASYFERQQADTEGRAKEALVQTLYPKESVYYDRSFAECITETKSIEAAELQAFHSAFYSPKGAILSIVGDIDLEKTVAAVKSAFCHWQGAEVPAFEEDNTPLPSERKRVDVQIPDKANASIVIGHPVKVQRTSADFFAAKLANAALGGDTIAARLGKKIRREAGLTYGIYSAFTDVSRAGAPFKIELSVNPKNVDKALALIDEVVAQYLKDGISPEELARESSSAAGTYLVQLRRCDSIASALTDAESLGLGVQAMDEFATLIQSVSKNEVDAALRKYIRPESFVTVVAGTLS
ncbi:MAG TPA: pitrilysin family protein [Planktothrix sp.]|jgi:zinc protease